MDLQTNLKYHKAEALLVKLKELQKSGAQAGDSIVYKINTGGQEETIKAEDKVQDLESRISKLEPILANTGRTKGIFYGNSILELRGVHNLLEEVQRIQKCTDTIPGNSSDQVTKKLTQLSEELDVFNQRKKNLEVSDSRLVKVNEI